MGAMSFLSGTIIPSTWLNEINDFTFLGKFRATSFSTENAHADLLFSLGTAPAQTSPILKLLQWPFASVSTVYFTMRGDLPSGVGEILVPRLSVDGPSANHGIWIAPKGTGIIYVGQNSSHGIRISSGTSTSGSLSLTSNTGELVLDILATSGLRFVPSVILGGNANISGDTASDSASKLLVRGISKGVRIGTSSTAGSIDGVDNTGSGSYQKLAIGGASIDFTISGTAKASIDASGNFSIGTTASSTGLVRIPYASHISARNSGNTGDISLLALQTINTQVNVINIDADSASAGIILPARFAGGAVTTSDVGSIKFTVWRDSSGATTKLVYNNSGTLQSLVLGTNIAGDTCAMPGALFLGGVTSGGQLSIPYNTTITSRNNANNNDITLTRANTVNSVADVVKVGDQNSAGVVLRARSGGAAPSASDLNSGEWAVWRDTVGATTKLYYNNAGSIQSVALA